MSKAKIGVALICRYNSSRLRGKILKEIGGVSILMHIVKRLRLVLSDDQVVVTTSIEKTDDIIVNFCKEKGLQYYRGSLDNVTERIIGVAEEFEWDYTLRLNGDNLFIDVDTLSELIDIASTKEFDLISNVKGRTYPYGMSIELFRTSFFRKVYDNFIVGNKRYQEHVTLYLYENEGSGKYYFKQNIEVPEASGVQLAIDTPEDFVKANAIMEEVLKAGGEYDLKSLIKIFNNVI